MATATAPYYVSFTHDAIPQRVDHSRARPGPAGGTANLAGYTSVTSKARLVFAWDTSPARADGRIPFFARSVNVYFRMTDFVVAISSNYTAASCAYRVTRRHEFDAHIYDPIRIFHSYRDILVRRLNAVAVPTRSRPQVVAPNQVEARQGEIEQRVVTVIGRTRQELARELRQARDRHDAAGSYRLVYRQCTAAEWASGR